MCKERKTVIEWCTEEAIKKEVTLCLTSAIPENKKKNT